jgi:FkbM family methyltransferase
VIKSVIRTLLHPLRRPISWAFQRGLVPGALRRLLPYRWALEPFTIYGDGWTCRWFPAEFDSVGRRIFWTGLRDWERETLPVMLQNISQAKCFIDVGANTGIYSVLGCTINPAVRVVAVEPTPRVCRALENNIAQNGYANRVTVLNIALADKEGEVDFHEAHDATMSSLAPKGYRGQTGKVIQVKCRTLDAVVAEMGLHPDFIKIDVEGFEGVVLSGAHEVLRTHRPRLVLEANPGDATGPVAAILGRYGYHFHLITDQGPQPRPELVPHPVYRNWLCLPD